MKTELPAMEDGLVGAEISPLPGQLGVKRYRTAPLIPQAQLSVAIFLFLISSLFLEARSSCKRAERPPLYLASFSPVEASQNQLQICSDCGLGSESGLSVKYRHTL